MWLSVLVAVLSGAGASAAPPPRPVTVGTFADRLARQLGFQPRNPVEARELLSGAGVTFAGSLDEPLTAGRMVGLLSDLGLEGKSSGDPGRPISSGMTERLAGLAASGILGQGGVPPPKPEGSVPNSCQALERSLCFQCCLAAIGPISVVPQRAIDLCNSSCTLMGAPPASTSTP
ncbi:MAG TPA: hypothetical protein VFQ07_09785 [Candidatus Polarisedimenticolia bacterium]|nr:hypothetical protein [Candidatus Polarisedimenticolia bacterium]